MAAPLNPEDATGHTGETATIWGVGLPPNTRPNVQDQPMLLGLRKPSPKAVFTAVIYGDTRRIRDPRDGASRQAHLCDGEDQRLPWEAGDRVD